MWCSRNRMATGIFRIAHTRTSKWKFSVICEYLIENRTEWAACNAQPFPCNGIIVDTGNSCNYSHCLCSPISFKLCVHGIESIFVEHLEHFVAQFSCPCAARFCFVYDLVQRIFWTAFACCRCGIFASTLAHPKIRTLLINEAPCFPIIIQSLHENRTKTTLFRWPDSNAIYLH